MGMLVVLITMAAVGLHIHVSDVRERIVPSCDLLFLCVQRLVLCAVAFAMQCCGLDVWAGLDANMWNGATLMQQALRGGLLVVLVLAINAVLSRKGSSEAVGAGDVKLYFVYCLYLDEATTVLFLLISTGIGVVQAIGCLISKQRTFAFAPALVWGCFLALSWHIFSNSFIFSRISS